MPLTTTLQNLGRAKYEALDTLTQVALEVSAAAARHECDPDNAAELYAAYYKAASGGSKVTMTDQTTRVQISKLRQIIKAKDPVLVRTVLAMCRKKTSAKVISPYHAIVAACRAQQGQRRALSERQIMRLIKRK